LVNRASWEWWCYANKGATGAKVFSINHLLIKIHVYFVMFARNITWILRSLWRSPDSSVSIVTWLRVGRPGFW
jgi:hypothetical protein